MENILRCKLQNVNYQNAVKSTQPAMHMASNVECKLHIASHQNAIKCHMQRAGPRGPFMRNVCMQGQDSAVALLSKGAREYFICKSSPFSTLFALLS